MDCALTQVYVRGRRADEHPTQFVDSEAKCDKYTDTHIEELDKRAPISVKFEIPYFTVSGIQVRYLKIVEKSGYSAYVFLPSSMIISFLILQLWSLSYCGYRIVCIAMRWRYSLVRER